MNPVLLADSRFLDGTPTATDTASGYDVLNIRDLRTFTAWKGNSAGTKYLTVDCGTAKEADALSIGPGHNLWTARAALSVEYSDDNVTWYVALQPFLVWEDNSLLKVFPAVTARYWRVKIQTASVAAKIAVALVGKAIEFPYPPATPYTPATEKIEAESSRSKLGTLLGTVVRHKPWEIKNDWKILSRSFIEETIAPFWRDYVSNLSPFIFAWDLERYPTDVRFGKVPDEYAYATPVSRLAYYDSFSLPIEGVRESGARAPFPYEDGLLCYLPLDDPADPLKFYGQGSPTFIRATTRTFRGSNGFIQSAASGNPGEDWGYGTNLLSYSEDFSNGVWSTVTGALVEAGFGAPNGKKIAQKFIEDGTNGYHERAHSVDIPTGGTHVLSAYVRAAERNWFRLMSYDGSFHAAYFNAATGVVGTTIGGVTAAISPADGGWYRASIAWTAPAYKAGSVYLMVANADGGESYAGTPGSGLYVWGAQLEKAAAATPYIKTRLQCRVPIGVLIEGQRTNLYLYSGDISQATNHNTPIITANYGIAPDGTQTSTLIEDNLATDTEGKQRSVVIASDTGQKTFSIFAKAGTLGSVLLNISMGGATYSMHFNLTTGAGTVYGGYAPSASGSEYWGNGWWRVWIAGANANTPVGYGYVMTGTGVISETGTIEVWGGQFEEAAFPSFYIPTTSAAATRNRDDLTFPSSGNVLGSIGTVAVTFDEHVDGQVDLLGNDSGFNAVLYMSATSGYVWTYDGTGGTSTPAVVPVGSLSRVAVRYGGTAMKMALNGALGASAVFDGDFSLSATQLLGYHAATGKSLYGHIKSLRSLSRPLSDAEMQMASAA